MKNIPLAYNSIPIERLASTLGHYSNELHTKIISDFEAALQRYLHVSSVVALNSGTAALHLALKALGVGEGDWVIAPTFTYVATINPIRYVGANPIFVECEGINGNMDPEWLKKAIMDSIHQQRKIKAIIIVHTYGMPAQLEEIMALSDHYSIPLIEDAAESLGSTLNNKMTGTWGQIGVLSFNNNKVVTTFGGGAVVTNDDRLASKIRWLSQQARDPLPYYEHREVGFNYAMGALNAAAGMVALPEIDQKITHRQHQLKTYQEYCPSHWYFQQQYPSTKSNCWLIPALTGSSEEREAYQLKLGALGYETRRLWRPMHEQPVFKEYPFYGTNRSQDLFARGFCLPCGEMVSPEEIPSLFS